MNSKAIALIAKLRRVIKGPMTIALTPALCFLSYLAGGEQALILLALFLPALLLALNATDLSKFENMTDGLTNLKLRGQLIKFLDEIISAQKTTGRTTACLAFEIDDYSAIKANFGDEAADDLLAQSAQRLVDTLREHDIVARLDGPRFAAALAPIKRADLETLIQLSARLQAAMSEPYSINATKVYSSCTIGFCLPTRAPAQSGDAYLDAAEVALADAKHNGAGSIRAYTANQTPNTLDRGMIIADVAEAIESGQITPWFQPQVSTDTGLISGMEALARWEHPTKGILSPAQFLPAIEELGLMERLGEVILYQSLMCMKAWEEAGFDVPTVSVNFSQTELANPKLVDKISWELDRFELSPAKLTIEVLESVISTTANDLISRNIWALKEHGCHIDLDDYGTGHASIANIRRFAVDRIKIDRSYVSRCDLDQEQQNVLAAILAMAERIGLTTLAEGVETVGEHAMLAQLGCNHVQGFSISRPFPFEKSLEWMDQHHKKLAQTPQIGKRAS